MCFNLHLKGEQDFPKNCGRALRRWRKKGKNILLFIIIVLLLYAFFAWIIIR